MVSFHRKLFVTRGYTVRRQLWKQSLIGMAGWMGTAASRPSSRSPPGRMALIVLTRGMCWSKLLRHDRRKYRKHRRFLQTFKTHPSCSWSVCVLPWKNKKKHEVLVVGSWRDDDGAIYKITMDEGGWSCSASIERQDGAPTEMTEKGTRWVMVFISTLW